MATDQVPGGAWRGLARSNWRWLGMAIFPMDEPEQTDTFIWKQGKDLVTVSKAGDSWHVSWLTQGRLLGPRLTVYEATHRQAKFAAWDVMAKVISVSNNEEEGIQVAVRVAQWMRGAGVLPNTSRRA